MKIEDGTKLDFSDVLIKPKRSVQVSRKLVELEREFYFYHSPKKWKGIPLIASNMYSTGSFAMAKELAKLKMITCLHKHYSIQEIVDFFKENPDLTDYVWISVGIVPNDIDKLLDLCLLSNQNGLDSDKYNLCIDVANGYSDYFIKQCAEYRRHMPFSIIMAGNIVSSEMAHEIIVHGGADIVKVGIGSGGHCATRRVVGVGMPQLSAIIECADAAHGLKSSDKRLGLICSDGGCKEISDITKAFCVADFVMCGTMFAGFEENEGEWEYTSGEQYSYYDESYKGTYPFIEGGNIGIGFDYSTKICTFDKSKDKIWKTPQNKNRLKFYGMSSKEAQETHYGGQKDYVASEGEVSYIPYKGKIEPFLKEIMGGIRSCCAYINAPSIKDMGKCCTFLKVNHQK